jgi:hypothetical protein
VLAYIQATVLEVSLPQLSNVRGIIMTLVGALPLLSMPMIMLMVFVREIHLQCPHVIIFNATQLGLPPIKGQETPMRMRMMMWCFMIMMVVVKVVVSEPLVSALMRVLRPASVLGPLVNQSQQEG